MFSVLEQRGTKEGTTLSMLVNKLPSKWMTIKREDPSVITLTRVNPSSNIFSSSGLTLESDYHLRPLFSPSPQRRKEYQPSPTLSSHCLEWPQLPLITPFFHERNLHIWRGRSTSKASPLSSTAVVHSGSPPIGSSFSITSSSITIIRFFRGIASSLP